MTEAGLRTRDRGVGFTVGAGLLAIAGAVVMYLNPETAIAGWGFALAMTAAVLAVIAAQLYW